MGSVYARAFYEVNDILKYTDEELMKKVPKSFLQFLRDNMCQTIDFNLIEGISLDRQIILPETEAILSLMYRSYWCTEEEKIEFKRNSEIADSNETEEIKQDYPTKIEDMLKKQMEERQEDNLQTALVDTGKEGFFRKIIKKITSIFKKKS